MGFDLNLSEDQRQILETAGALVADTYPLGRLREGLPDDLRPLAAIGVFSLSAGEAQGGAGFTLVEEALVHTLLGRSLLSTRTLATSVAAALARLAGEADLAARIATLDRTVCAALVRGDHLLLLDPARAALALVFDRRSLAVVTLEDVREAEGLGHSIPVARASAGATVVATTRHPRSLAIADLLVSAQLLGVAEGARDLAVSYARFREQFGKPIGAFQAIKHHAADMAIAAEMVSAQRDVAALALADDRPDADFQIAALRRLASRAALANARACVQIHGGIGFSAEADAHHFVKQAHLLSRLGEAAAILDYPAPLAPLRPISERT